MNQPTPLDIVNVVLPLYLTGILYITAIRIALMLYNKGHVSFIILFNFKIRNFWFFSVIDNSPLRIINVALAVSIIRNSEL